MQPKRQPHPTRAADTDRRRSRRRGRKSAANQEDLPAVPPTVAGRVLCAHPEILTAILAFVLIFGFVLPSLVIVITVIAMVAFAWGWPSLLNAHAPKRTSSLLLLVGLSSLVLTSIYGEFSLVAMVCVLGIIGAFLLEMTRNPRPDLVNSLSITVTGLMVITPGAAWIILQNDDLWRLLYITAGVIALGCCLGMTISYSWPARPRAIAVAFGGLLFALGVAIALSVMQRLSAAKVALITGGQVPKVWVTFCCVMAVGVVMACIFSMLCLVFNGSTSCHTVSAALALGSIPMLVGSLPFYVLARLLVDNAHPGW